MKSFVIFYVSSILAFGCWGQSSSNNSGQINIMDECYVLEKQADNGMNSKKTREKAKKRLEQLRREGRDIYHLPPPSNSVPQIQSSPSVAQEGFIESSSAKGIALRNKWDAEEAATRAQQSQLQVQRANQKLQEAEMNVQRAEMEVQRVEFTQHNTQLNGNKRNEDGSRVWRAEIEVDRARDDADRAKNDAWRAQIEATIDR